MKPTDALRAFLVPATNNWFLIGYGERQVTLRTQQVRALNLVWALIETATIKSGHHVVVIGGGAAGLTAAVALAQQGVIATVLEREGCLMPLQRNCTKRHLHPHIFDWPEDTAENNRADLPILDWRAGWARDVALEFESGFREATHAADGHLSHDLHVDSINLDSPRVGYVEFVHGAQPVRRTLQYDAVIFALGFGVEEPYMSGRRGSYWADDALDQHGVIAKGKYLVSGSGDGGLIDTFRLLLPELRQPDLARLVRNSISEEQAFRNWIRAVDEKAGGETHAADQSASLHESYDSFDVSHFGASELDSELQAHLNRRCEVNLITRDSSPFSLSARPLHRFIFSRLFFCTPAQLRVTCKLEISAHDIVPHGTGVQFNPTFYEPKIYQHAIIRHGPTKAPFAVFPGLGARLTGWKPISIPIHPLYPDSFFSRRATQALGSGGPTLADYADELWGRGFLTESVDGRLPLSRFSHIGYELRLVRNDTNRELSYEDDNQWDREKEEEGDQHPSSHEHLAISAPSELEDLARRRARIPVPERVLRPGEPSWDFDIPTFIRGDAGTGKTTLVQQLIRQQLEARGVTERGAIVPLHVRQSALGILEALPNELDAITEAALYSAEVSNFSRASSELRIILGLKDPLQRRARVFLDGVETAFGPQASEGFSKVCSWIVKNGHQLIVTGRTFPIAPSFILPGRNFHTYQLVGIVPHQRGELIAAATRHEPQASPDEYPATPFLLVEWLRAEKKLQRKPRSTIEVYRTRLKDIPKPALIDLATFAKNTLLRDVPQIGFDRTALPATVLTSPQAQRSFCGNFRLEFVHLSYAEFLSTLVITDEELRSFRNVLRRQRTSWHHLLDVLPMAHATNPSQFEEAVGELVEDAEPDRHHTQLTMLFRSLSLLGESAGESWKKWGTVLLECVWRVLRQPSGQFGPLEEELLRHVVICLTRMPRGIQVQAPPSESLFGEPKAVAWAVAGLVTRQNVARAPDAHWWQIIFAEARSYLESGISFEEFIAATEGSPDRIERDLAKRILDELDWELDILITPDTFTRVHRVFEKSQRPQVLECLTDSVSRNRADACLVLQNLLSAHIDALAAILECVAATDPSATVRAVASSSEHLTDRGLGSLLGFLGPGNYTGFSQKSLVQELLNRHLQHDDVVQALVVLIARGENWALLEDHGPQIAAIPECRVAISSRLEEPISTLTVDHIRAAKQLPELAPRLLEIGNELIHSMPTDEDERILRMLAGCIDAMPESFAEARALSLTCLALPRNGNPRPIDEVHSAAVKSLAAESAYQSTVLEFLESLDAPYPAETALSVHSFGSSSTGRALARRILNERQPKGTRFEDDWHNCRHRAITMLADHGADDEFLTSLFRTLSTGTRESNWTRDVQRSLILPRAGLSLNEIIALVEEDLSRPAESQHPMTRAAAANAIPWNHLGDSKHTSLVDWALRESNHDAQRELWGRLKDQPRLKAHLSRLSREDLWAVRYAYFVLLSETPKGLEELRTNARELAAVGGSRTLANMVAPLSRDPTSSKFIAELLRKGRVVVSHILQLKRHDPEIRAEARRLLSADRPWVAQFHFSDALAKFFADDPVVQKLVYEQCVLDQGPQSGLDTLDLCDVVAILENWPEAASWLREIAIATSPKDFNALAIARRAQRNDEEVRAILERDLKTEGGQDDAQYLLQASIDATRGAGWAAPLVSRHVNNHKKEVRLAASIACLGEGKLPPQIQNADGRLRAPALLGATEEEEDIRLALTNEWKKLPVSETEKRSWLIQVGTRDFSPSVRAAASSPLGTSGELRPLRGSYARTPRWQGTATAQGSAEFEENCDWLLFKLVSSLPDNTSPEEAADIVDGHNEVYSEHINTESSVRMIRLAADAADLPRDRRIWPTANLVLAWTRASQLRASDQRSFILACSTAPADALLTTLDVPRPGAVLVGPVFFGFTLPLM